MIVIVGNKYRETEVQNGASGMRYCPGCQLISNLTEVQRRNWLTLFFIPVFPVSKPQHFLKCSRCGFSQPL
ncbi:zinc ribbon domain-containing protein [Halocola ammonii]